MRERHKQAVHLAHIEPENIYGDHVAGKDARPLEILYDISTALNSFMQTEPLLEFTIYKAKELLDAEGASIILWDQRKDELYFPAVATEERNTVNRLKRLRFPAACGIAGWVFQHGKPALLPDVSRDDRFHDNIDESTGFVTKSILCVPLRDKESIIGVLEAVNKKNGVFTREDQFLLGIIANDIGIVIQRARLYQDLQETESLFRAQNNELEKAIERTQNSEKRLRAIIGSSPNAIAITDLQGNIIECNPRAANICGFRDRSQLIGMSALDLIAPRDRQRFEENMRGVSKDGLDRTLEYNFLTDDGCEFPVEVSACIIYDRHNNPISFVAIAKDITERKQMENALRESEERCRNIVENSTDGIAMIQDDRLIYVNDAICRIFGYEKTELLDEILLKLIAPEDELSMQRRLKEEKASRRYTTKGARKDGTQIYIEVSESNSFMYKGRLTILTTIRDLTDIKQMEEEMLRSKRIESLSTLARGIAHDFNNILTAILANICIARINLEHGGKLDEAIENLTQAEREFDSVKRLTQQLSAFAQGEPPVREMANTNEILRGSVTFALSGSRCGCEFSIPKDLWAAELDTSQIEQVIHNMIINAEQAMPDGGTIKVSAKNVNLNSEVLPLAVGPYIKISIQDQGIGISKNHLSRIFDPYFTTKEKGRGLGLAMSYSIIKKHKGHISVESELGLGTTFHIYLPASPMASPDKQEKKRDQPAIGSGGKILLMDDEKHIRDSVASMLVSIGCHQVVTSIDGGETIQLYKEAMESDHPFDAVIMDLTVPGGMGCEKAIIQLKRIDPSIKAIVSSGYHDSDVMLNFGSYGFTGRIVKPYKTQELREVLYQALNADQKVQTALCSHLGHMTQREGGT